MARFFRFAAGLSMTMLVSSQAYSDICIVDQSFLFSGSYYFEAQYAESSPESCQKFLMRCDSSHTATGEDSMCLASGGCTSPQSMPVDCEYVADIDE